MASDTTSQKGIFARTVRKAAPALVVLLITGVLIEAGLRVFDPIGIKYFFEAAKYFKSMQPNENYAYIHTPGDRLVLQGVDVSINSQGFRGYEFEKNKAPGKKRIMILGDSVVFGWGAPQEDIFPLQLQALFDEANGNVEVIPAGVGSWNTRTEYEYLRSAGVDLAPDVLILIIVPNDIEPKDVGRTQVARELLPAGKRRMGGVKGLVDKIWRGGVHHSYLMMHVQYIFKTRKNREEQTRFAHNSPQWEDARLALDGIIDFCNDRGVEFIPYLYGSSAAFESKPALNHYKSYLESRDIQVFTMPDSLFAAKYRNSIVDGHANSAGHTIISRVLYHQIRSRLAN